MPMSDQSDFEPSSSNLESLVAALRQKDAYPHTVKGPIVVHQTHISIVVLAGDYAYKIKKPIKTDFLDYSSLALRQQYCHEELRLDSRYAADLYLDVVPITAQGKRICVDGEGEVIEYAVKMRRFPDGALLSQRIKSRPLSMDEVFQLAKTVAKLHQSASVGDDRIAEHWPDFLVSNLHEIFRSLMKKATKSESTELEGLENWSDEFLQKHLVLLSDRSMKGFIRSCHGDLHLGNIIQWNGQFVPFDGIEFNEHLQWIDVLSDAAFLAMDLAACGHPDLSRSFTNAYIEHTADYDSLELLRLFLVYRALVRGLAATMRSDAEDRRQHIELASRYTRRETPQLWITHGFSGSGKTTRSEAVVQRRDAFRIRSDVERKRLFGLSTSSRPSIELRRELYSDSTNGRTYARLSDLADKVLKAGYSVIVDATFLKEKDRRHFYELARRHGVAVSILDCHSDPITLRQRIANRIERDDDASDADLDVLEHQMAHHEPLSELEQRCVDSTFG
jgi:uncharacterized protein